MNKIPLLVVVFTALTMFFSACGSDKGSSADDKSNEKVDVKQGSFVDSRDGKSYTTVFLGDQEWMAENLNYATAGSYCYDGLEENCTEFGRLYSWYDAQEVCPEGWHLPTDEEWNLMLDFVGGRNVAGRKLKTTSGWENDGGWENDLKGDRCNGLDSYGFSVKPSGNCAFDNVCLGTFFADFWSNKSHGTTSAYYWSFSFSTDSVLYYDGEYRGNLKSVRCLKNN